MFNKLKWLLIWWLIILTAGIVGVGFYTSQKSTLIENEVKEEVKTVKEEINKIKEEIEQVKAVSRKPEETAEVDTSGWKTYWDEKLRLGFKYPKEWGWDRFLPPKNHLDLPGTYALNVVEKELLDSISIDIKRYCDEYLDFPFVTAPNVRLSCSEIKVSSGQKGILRDSFICSANLPGGSPDCFYERSFIIEVPNEDYPILLVRTSWGYECFREKCDPFKLGSRKTMQNCMQEEYERCKMKEDNKTKLQLFKIFINTIEIY